MEKDKMSCLSDEWCKDVTSQITHLIFTAGVLPLCE